MKHWLKGLAGIAVLLLILALLPGRVWSEEIPETETETYRDVTYKDSGRAAVAKPSFEDLRRKLDALTAYSTLFSTTPIVSGSDYRPGVLTEEARSSVLMYLNYYREAAGLDPVSFTSDLDLSASYGALCLAMLNNGLTHTPQKPEDMSDEDYKKAYAATTSSNISWCAGYDETAVLFVAVDGQMDDDDEYNISVVGHRRWLLNPYTKTMGIGCAKNIYTYGSYTLDDYFTDIRVFGTGVETEQVTDYEFISWPASGDNLSDMFYKYDPWSITLNPERYQTPDRSKVKVVLTRLDDGEKWAFSKDTDISIIDEDHDYFNVDDQGYGGISNCIIFRPSGEIFDISNREFTVDVTGLYTRSGASTSLHYKVNFTAYDSVIGHEYEFDHWYWTADYSEAYASFIDEAHHLSQQIQATVTKKTTAATCENDGKTVYTAKVIYQGKTYTDTKTVVLPALGHKWGAATFKWTGYTACTATRTCGNNSAHKMTVEAQITSETTKEPTHDEPGWRVHTATATFPDGLVVSDTRQEMLPALDWEWERLSGSDRYVTMTKITQKAYEDGSQKTLIVATGSAFPDALSGAALAGIYECPIILTRKAELVQEAQDEIARLASPEGCVVYILGGRGAITDAVMEAIGGIPNVTGVERISGSTRQLTSFQVYEKGIGFWSDTAILATGSSFADALSISPYAYTSRSPILLTGKKGVLSEEIQGLLSGNTFSKVLIIGGKGAISEETENYLRDECGLEVLRLSGSDRYQTSADIMRWELGLKEDAPFQPEVVMTINGLGAATGSNFADALASVSLLGKNRAPLLLVTNNKGSREIIEQNIDELIRPNAAVITKGYIFGGRSAVNDEIEQLLQDASLE